MKQKRCVRACTLKRTELGFADNSKMGVNIQLLWMGSKSERTFIHEFSKTLAHEFLHIEISHALGRKLLNVSQRDEEETIRRILHEEWDAELKDTYEKDNT